MVNYKLIKINGVNKAEHRLIMEAHLGRELLDTEIVHHEDRNRRNNDISNLKVTTQSQHIKDHHKRNELHKAGYETGCINRYKNGKRVIVMDDLGNELFISFSIKCASVDTGIPIMTLWRILNGKATQKEKINLKFF